MVTGTKVMLLGLMLATGSAAASPGRMARNFQKHLERKSLENARSERHPANSACVDLSGQWKGLCVLNDEDGTSTEVVELTLKQEQCSKLTFDDELESLSIPGPNHMSETGADGSTFTVNAFSEWQVGGSVLKIYHSAALTYISEPYPAFHLVSAGVSDYRLVDGKLVVSSESSDYDSFSSGASFSSEFCEYEKITP